MNAVRHGADVEVPRAVPDPVRVGPAAGTGLATAAAGSMVWSVSDARKSTPGHAAPAGWYYVATGAPGMRYWDGTAWTEHAAVLPPPAPAVVPATLLAATTAEVAPAAIAAAAVAAGAVATPAVAPRRSRARRRPPLLLTWWVWLLVAGVAGCGVIAWTEARDADVATSPSTVISPPTTTGDETPPQATYFR